MRWKVGEPVTAPVEAEKLMRPLFRKYMKKQEVFIVAALDARNRPIGRPWVVALGTLSSVNVHPRDVFREAVRRNAHTVLLAHNHPSGDPTPSRDDRELTRRLERSGDTIGIPITDHLVITSDRCRSIIHNV